MQVLSSSPNVKVAVNNTAEARNKNDVSFKSNNIGKLIVHEGYKFPKVTPAIAVLGLVTALTSAAGFGLGGAGLNYDHYYKKSHGIKDGKPKNDPNSISIQDFVSSLGKPDQKLKLKFAVDEGKENKEETGYIDPVSEFGKFGMKAAKIGIFFSGVAGVFNGIAMRVPLMSVGEGLNIAASPIVNTPTGFGLFNIALATVFAGRALENNPALKLNQEVLASKSGLTAKAGYVLDNMGNCLKEVMNSSKEVIVQFGNLFKADEAKAAKTFFRDCIFDVKSSTMTFSEKILADGSTVIERGMKSYPYRMHLASVILATGGAMLLATGLLKKIGILKDKNLDSATKTSFKVAEVGGCLDNIGLSYAGAEKVFQGNVGAGLALGISGLGILSGTPNAEKDDGRGRQWLGTAFLFGAFVIERFHELVKTMEDVAKYKPGKEVSESAQLIRQWEVHLPNIFGKKFVNKHYKEITALSNPEKYAEVIKSMLASEDGEVREFARFMETAKAFFDQDKFRKFIPNDKVTNDVLNELREFIAQAGIKGKDNVDVAKEFKILSEGDLGEIIKSVIAENVRVAGKKYREVLEQIGNNGSLATAITKEAKAVAAKLV